MPQCYYCNEPVQDDASAHLVSNSPFQLAHPKCAQKHSTKRPTMNRIIINDARPSLSRYMQLRTCFEHPESPTVYARHVYAQEDNGTVWRFHRLVPDKHLCTFIAAVLAQGNIDPSLWTVVRKGQPILETTLSQTQMTFDYSNQQEAA